MRGRRPRLADPRVPVGRASSACPRTAFRTYGCVSPGASGTKEKKEEKGGGGRSICEKINRDTPKEKTPLAGQTEEITVRDPRDPLFTRAKHVSSMFFCELSNKASFLAKYRFSIQMINSMRNSAIDARLNPRTALRAHGAENGKVLAW